jgi:hypothetical protein
LKIYACYSWEMTLKCRIVLLVSNILRKSYSPDSVKKIGVSAGRRYLRNFCISSSICEIYNFPSLKLEAETLLKRFCKGNILKFVYSVLHPKYIV